MAAQLVQAGNMVAVLMREQDPIGLEVPFLQTGLNAGKMVGIDDEGAGRVSQNLTIAVGDLVDETNRRQD